MQNGHIRLRGVRVHNLQNVDLDLPHHRLIAFCGVSGSGKTSLALDTVYAEGQRRYIETFSAYTRQFLEQLEKPDADSIQGIPPAIAVTHKNPSRSNRATVGTATETNAYLALLFARIGEITCPECGRPVRRDSPESIAESLADLPEGPRLMVGFSAQAPTSDTAEWLANLIEDGYIRAVVGSDVVSLGPELGEQLTAGESIDIIIDRLKQGDVSTGRLRESLETAINEGPGRCVVFHDGPKSLAKSPSRKEVLDDELCDSAVLREISDKELKSQLVSIDGKPWLRREFSRALRCNVCQLDFPEPEPQLFDFNNPLGACSKCEGFGNTVTLDMNLVVPDKTKSIRGGAIAPWNTPAYEHELQELLALANDYGIPVDIPFSELNDEHLRIIRRGVPEREFGGLRGFFRWLDRHKYKMHLRVFASRWRTYHVCPECQGARFRPETLAVRIGGKNIAELSALRIRDAIVFFDSLELLPWQQQVARTMLEAVCLRLRYLAKVGVGYLALDRPLRSLSGGEAQRVALTGTLGSNLVDMLYVLDEPTVGLHPANVQSLVDAVEGLRDRGNTVLVVDHDEEILRRSDHLVELGPEAGAGGGQVVFQGTPAEIIKHPTSRTGDWLAGRRGLTSGRRRPAEHGSIRLLGARGHNLQNLKVDFPLGVLCVVTGVSGAGKSTLVQKTLYPALVERLNQSGASADGKKPLDYDEVLGTGPIERVLMVDQSPIGRSSRSNPVTYIKAFDAIRALFAEQSDAQIKGIPAGHFSFNVAGGRCEACQGAGYVEIDMQFMADVYMRCQACHGRRYRREVLDVKYRGRSIAEVLDMTVREAFSFFRKHRKIEARLKCLIDVGLDYLTLGQPAPTLSGGEAQRLKLASFLEAKHRGRTLFLLDEPTTGLHFSDVVQLIDCFDSLLEVGHSLIVVEHNLQLIRAADYLIDLGPGAADEGGRIVAMGTPEQVAASPESVTGRFLAEAFAQASKNNHGAAVLNVNRHVNEFWDSKEDYV